MRATFLVALTDAAGVGTGLAIMGVPLALPLASLVFLGAFIPLVGALISGLLAVVVALLAKGIVYALITLGLLIAVNQLEAHVLQPLVMGRAVSIHPLAVVLAISTGGVLAGIVGALLAVPTVAFLNNAMQVLLAPDPSAEAEKQTEDADDDERDPAGRAGQTRGRIRLRLKLFGVAPRAWLKPSLAAQQILRGQPPPPERRRCAAPGRRSRPGPRAFTFSVAASGSSPSGAHARQGGGGLGRRRRCRRPVGRAPGWPASDRRTAVGGGAGRRLRAGSARRRAGRAEKRVVLASVGWLGRAGMRRRCPRLSLVVGRASVAPLGARAGPAGRAAGRGGSGRAGMGGVVRRPRRRGDQAGRDRRPRGPAVERGPLALVGQVDLAQPDLFCRRRAQRGAHQQSSPSNFITDGTRNIRTTVASSSSAAIRPKARYFINTRSENTNEPATTASTSAAAVIRRPVVAVPIRMASAVDMPRSRASTIRETRNTS